MFEFSQIKRSPEVTQWAQMLFAIRYKNSRYRKDYWNLRGFTNDYPDGINLANSLSSFKLQLIM